MCGIAGFIDFQTGADAARQPLQRMLDRIAHRGPDDQGEFFEGPVALGHRRLSIVDLSPLGHQPMTSASGRYVVVYNGEIYNHQALRAELASAGVGFRGHSDTEVLLALIEQRGLTGALRRCVGMFAIALWDRHERTLQLARDRFGEKPLYFGGCNGRMLFGSELKALTTHPAFDPSLDGRAVRDVVARGFAAPDRSIYRQVGQVPPGACVTLALGDGTWTTTVERYWDTVAVAAAGASKPFAGSLADAADELERRLSAAVVDQMQADVPVGAFLSGGVDSSVVTALMVQAGGPSVRSYSIGFHRASHNEAEYAKAVAQHLGTQHTEWYVSEGEAEQLVPTLARIYDEPLADASQIPTLVLARLVRRDVTVALSGDGADEVLGGYPKYARGEALWAAPGRDARAWLARCADRSAALAGRPLSARLPWHRLSTAAALYGASTQQGLAEQLCSLNRDPLPLVAAALREEATIGQPELPPAASYRRTAMRHDLLSYLPGDILTKVDRATMSASLESRAPMLDHRVFEFAATLPDSHLFDASAGKKVLRELLYRLVPRALVDRPKSGFQAPIADWLRHGLRGWAYDSIGSRAAAEVLDIPRCRALLDLHCEGRHDLSARVWPVVTMAAWANERAAGA